MLTIDIIGLSLSVLLIGIRYPHYVIAAALLHDAGMILMTLFFNGQLDTVVTAGAFSSITVSSLDGVRTAAIAFSGPLVNYALSALIGGIEFEKSANILNTFAKLRHPMAIINLRLAISSFLVTLWHLFWS